MIFGSLKPRAKSPPMVTSKANITCKLDYITSDSQTSAVLFKVWYTAGDLAPVHK